MSGVLVFVEADKQGLKRSSREGIAFGVHLAQQLGIPSVEGVLVGANLPEDSALRTGARGVKKLHVYSVDVPHLEYGIYRAVLKRVLEQTGAKHVVFVNGNSGRALAPSVAAMLDAPLVSTITDFARKDGETLVLRRNVYSGKATADVRISVEKGVYMVMPNSVEALQEGEEPEIERVNADTTLQAEQKWNIEKVEQAEGRVPLTEAEIVVSGGRGMKGPENWHILEELADELGAALACSKPVTDMGWRPHSEHVGQTGITIRPTVYIAVGISGAIQHMAGVNGSKYIIAINKDPEAPIFRYASYGIVGDLFEVVPRLTEAIRKFKKERGG